MGVLFQTGRILLGLLLVIQGLLIVQSGYKDHLTSFKQLRTYVLGNPQIIDVIKASA